MTCKLLTKYFLSGACALTVHYIYNIEHRNLETRKTLTTSQFRYETFEFKGSST